MRIAALDVGSNSFHLMVADVETGGRINVLDRAKEMVRLGDSTLHQGVIAPEVFRRGLDALKALRRIADRHKVDALVAVATSAVRAAQLPGRARGAGPGQAPRGAVRPGRRFAGDRAGRRAGALLHVVVEAGRDPSGRELPLFGPAHRARARAPQRARAGRAGSGGLARPRHG